MANVSPLSIPVIGEFEGLQGFEDLQQDMEIGAEVGGGGAEAVAGAAGARGGGGGLGGMKAGKFLGRIGGMISMLLGPLGILVGIVSMMESTQKFLGMIMEYLNFVVTPFILPFMVLIGLFMKLIPMWMDFLSDPVGSLINLATTIGDFILDMWNGIKSSLAGLPGDFVNGLAGFFDPVSNFLEGIETGINDLLGIFGGGGGKDKGMSIGEAADTPGVQLSGSRATRELNMQQGFTRTMHDAERTGGITLDNSTEINVEGTDGTAYNSFQKENEKQNNKIMGWLQNWFGD